MMNNIRRICYGVSVKGGWKSGPKPNDPSLCPDFLIGDNNEHLLCDVW
jgi:hypothetical protein